jgi:lipopolysaccharide export system permease protein
MKFGLKKLDKLIVKSFIGPFIVTFFLVLFTVTMQFYWLYMDELIGKGLGVGLMMQLLLYMSATLVPMALPLGILLASIMTFGALGENYELVALKSSGISLFRFMRALCIFIVLLSIGAFFFNNNVIPVANLKSFSLLYDMRNQKPAMNITPGIFNRDIDGFAIRVGEKDKDGQHIKDVIIYDHTGKRGNNTVVIAEKGRMYPSDGGQSLIFELENGWRYEENNEQNTNKQTRMKFGKWYKVFDLSKFSFSRTNEELFKGNHEMMNVWQLGTHIDSFNRQRSKAIKTINAQVMPSLSIFQ